MAEFCFVSCDIIGHGIEPSVKKQTERIVAINRKVSEAIALATKRKVGAIWASGGDGGHLAFDASGAALDALGLIHELRSWALGESVRLRIAGHVGEAVVVKGADGRQQLVGDGINLCGSLINFATETGVVVSDDFRRLVEAEGVDGVRFHDARVVYLKHFSVCRLLLCSSDCLERKFQSQWGDPSKSERDLLREAIKLKHPWHVVYHAKRLLETNGGDEEALEALDRVAAKRLGRLEYTDRFRNSLLANPILDDLQPEIFGELVSSSELVDREEGEAFCHLGDVGDSMFVVLTGEVGVVMPEAPRGQGQEESQKIQRDIRMGPGQCVGELAATLGVPRTATLQAVGRTAVLALKKNRVQELREKRATPKLDLFSVFESGILEYLCNHAPYLVGLNETGPLGGLECPWEFLRGNVERIEVNAEPGDLLTLSDPKFSGDGVFVLVAGLLEACGMSRDTNQNPLEPGEQRASASSPQSPGLRIRGQDLPVIGVSIPRHFVHMHGDYTQRSEILEFIRLSPAPFVRRWESRLPAAIAALKADLTHRYPYDVFISYNSADTQSAEDIEKHLQRHGRSVYLNRPVSGEKFPSQIRAALLGSRVLIPIISKNVPPRKQTPMGRSRQSGSWVQEEIDFRLGAFDSAPNVLPIKLRGGPADSVASGLTPFVVDGALDERSLMELADAVDRLLKRTPVPYASARRQIPILAR